MRRFFRVTALAVLGFVLFCVTAMFFEWSQRPPWASLRRGMSADRVADIMGKPDIVDPSRDDVLWQYASGIRLWFVDGKLKEMNGGKGVSLGPP
jgi:hypothetical protein